MGPEHSDEQENHTTDYNKFSYNNFHIHIAKGRYHYNPATIHKKTIVDRLQFYEHGHNIFSVVLIPTLLNNG